MFKKLRTVIYSVKDILAAKEWYKKATGIDGTLVQPRTNAGGDIFIAIVADPFGNHIGLIEGA